MKRTLLTTLPALMFLFASAQFTVDPGVWKVVTIGGSTYRIFVPDDYETGGNYYFHIAFYGDGETSGTSLNSQVPGKWLVSPHNWDGAVHMNDGSVAKFIIFGIPNYGIQPDKYGAAIDSVFKVLDDKVDTNDTKYFSASGFSGGPGRMWSYLIQAGSSKRLLFQNTISMSPTSLGIDVTARSSAGRHWVWFSSFDNNGGTPPGAAHNLYNDIGSTEKILTDQQMADSCHCAEIWDSCMSIAGLGLQHGGNAGTNRWRWLVDPTDGSAPPPFPFAVGELRQKTYNGKNFIYYLPDTANRSTLKYYFIYNVLDASGQDSAYAVQRGLAKKYANGWNGKIPLCNGDTAVFTLFTQVEDPHLKATMEKGIQLALDSLPDHIFDTAQSRRMQNIFTGLGRGATTQLTYLMNKFVFSEGTAFFRENFGVYISLDHHDNGYISNSDAWEEVGAPLKSWWWSGNTSGYPYLVTYTRSGKDSADNRNPGAMTKITEIPVSYSSVTWDSAYSTAGETPSDNVFLWIIDTSECVPVTPPQPEGPFVVGRLRQKTFNDRDLLYYVPDTAQRSTLRYYFIYNILDAIGEDSAYAVQRGLAKKYEQGWNGMVPLCNGDTAVFTMVTQLENPHLKADMETGIQWALDSLPNHVFDTTYATNRMRNIFTGLGRGVTSEVTYLMDKFTILGQGTAHFSRNFGVLVALDQYDNGFISSNGWANIDTPFKSWWWTSNQSGYPYLATYTRGSKDSADNRNPGDLTKITELELNYSPITWDSAYSTAGTTPDDNVFIWITDTSNCGSLPVSRPSTRIMEGQPAAAMKFFSITPNPVQNVINIKWNAIEKGATTISIMDMDGRLLYRKVVSSGKGYNLGSIPVQSLAKGSYIVQLITGEDVITKKFIKQ